MRLSKYPRTPHLPFSPGGDREDDVLQDYNGCVGHEIVITAKMDGENATLYGDYVHARSLDSRHHPGRDWLKRFPGELAYRLPPGWRICGENLLGDALASLHEPQEHFYGFSLWDATLRWFEDMGIVPVTVLYRGPFVLQVLVALATTLDTSQHEGCVVRITAAIPYERFGTHVAQWVRPGHIQTDAHWRHAPLLPNRLA